MPSNTNNALVFGRWRPYVVALNIGEYPRSSRVPKTADPQPTNSATRNLRTDASLAWRAVSSSGLGQYREDSFQEGNMPSKQMGPPLSATDGTGHAWGSAASRTSHERSRQRKRYGTSSVSQSPWTLAMRDSGLAGYALKNGPSTAFMPTTYPTTPCSSY